jgi:hypothetical protein
MKVIAGALVLLSGVLLFASGAISQAIVNGFSTSHGPQPDSWYMAAYLAMGAGTLIVIIGFVLLAIGWSANLSRITKGLPPEDPDFG